VHLHQGELGPGKGFTEYTAALGLFPWLPGEQINAVLGSDPPHVTGVAERAKFQSSPNPQAHHLPPSLPASLPPSLPLSLPQRECYIEIL